MASSSCECDCLRVVVDRDADIDKEHIRVQYVQQAFMVSDVDACEMLVVTGGLALENRHRQKTTSRKALSILIITLIEIFLLIMSEHLSESHKVMTLELNCMYAHCDGDGNTTPR
eukprot:scaffold390677_cov21-Prasinocladus_malaysianus.AAC.2